MLIQLYPVPLARRVCKDLLGRKVRILLFLVRKVRKVFKANKVSKALRVLIPLFRARKVQQVLKVIWVRRALKDQKELPLQYQVLKVQPVHKVPLETPAQLVILERPPTKPLLTTDLSGQKRNGWQAYKAPKAIQVSQAHKVCRETRGPQARKVPRAYKVQTRQFQDPRDLKARKGFKDRPDRKVLPALTPPYRVLRDRPVHKANKGFKVLKVLKVTPVMLALWVRKVFKVYKVTPARIQQYRGPQARKVMWVQQAPRVLKDHKAPSVRKAPQAVAEWTPPLRLLIR